MATLLPVREVLRFDAAFVDARLVPWLRTHGFDGSIALCDDASAARIDDGVVALAWPPAALAHVLQGKLTRMDEHGLCARVSTLQALVRACGPVRAVTTSRARDIASDATPSTIPTRKPRDWMRGPGGRIVKGRARPVTGADDASSSMPRPMGAAIAAASSTGAATDPAAFAAHNFGRVLAPIAALIVDASPHANVVVERGCVWLEHDGARTRVDGA